MEDNYKSVFECNPSAQEIYVVDGMPFLEAGHAQGHSITTGKPVETVKRPATQPEVAETLTDDEKAAIAAEKAEAKKNAAEAKKAKAAANKGEKSKK